MFHTCTLHRHLHTNTVALISDPIDARGPFQVLNMCQMKPPRDAPVARTSPTTTPSVTFRAERGSGVTGWRQRCARFTATSDLHLFIFPSAKGLIYFHERLCLSHRDLLNRRFGVCSEICDEHLYEAAGEAAQMRRSGPSRLINLKVF